MAWGVSYPGVVQSILSIGVAIVSLSMLSNIQILQLLFTLKE